MFDFTLEWASRRSAAERAIDARAMTDKLRFQEAFVLPLALLIIFLFALGIMTGAHLNGRANHALPYLVSGAWVCPCSIPHRSPVAGHRTSVPCRGSGRLKCLRY